MQKLIQLGHEIPTGMAIKEPTSSTLIPLSNAVLGRKSSHVTDPVLAYTIPATTGFSYTRHGTDTCEVEYSAWTSSVLVSVSQLWSVQAATYVPGEGPFRAQVSLTLRVNGVAISADNGAVAAAPIQSFLMSDGGTTTDTSLWARCRNVRGQFAVATIPGQTYNFQMYFAARSVYTSGTPTAARAVTAYISNRSITVEPFPD